jgi:hypothetical protein
VTHYALGDDAAIPLCTTQIKHLPRGQHCGEPKYAPYVR